MTDRARAAVAWRWQPALFAAICAIPAAIAAVGDVSRGLALGFGVVPAAAIGIPPARRRRLMIVVAGIAIAAGLTVGSVLNHVPVLAVIVLFVNGVAAALWAGRSGVGMLTMILVVPMVGAGLGFEGVDDALGIADVVVVGSVVTWIVSLAWPDTALLHAADPASRRLVGIDPVDYGLRLGIAGALCASISSSPASTTRGGRPLRACS